MSYSWEAEKGILMSRWWPAEPWSGDPRSFCRLPRSPCSAASSLAREGRAGMGLDRFSRAGPGCVAHQVHVRCAAQAMPKGKGSWNWRGGAGRREGRGVRRSRERGQAHPSRDFPLAPSPPRMSLSRCPAVPWTPRCKHQGSTGPLKGGPHWINLKSAFLDMA